MTLDFGLHDKPVVNVAFDVADPPLFGVPVWEYYYQFEHYRPVVELGAARFARSPGAIGGARQRVPAGSFARPRGAPQTGCVAGGGAAGRILPARGGGVGANRQGGAVKICFLCNEYPPARHGGIGVFTRVMARTLARAGHQVRVLGACRRERGCPVTRKRTACGSGASAPDRRGWLVARWALARDPHRAGGPAAAKSTCVEAPDYEGWVAGWPSMTSPVVVRLHGVAQLLRGRNRRRASRARCSGWRGPPSPRRLSLLGEAAIPPSGPRSLFELGGGTWRCCIIPWKRPPRPPARAPATRWSSAAR